MTTFLIAFVSLACLLGAFTFVGLPGMTRRRRAGLASFFALLLAGLFFGYSDMLGRPKSTTLELARAGAEDVKVLGTYMLEGKGVYLWVQFPGVDEPRYYQLPWDEAAAKALQEAVRKNADEHGGGVRMRLPFELSWDKREPLFYPAPQPKLLDKPGRRPPAIYQAPEQES
jgi:hypothetical protein